jgi:peroxiredoxin
LLPLVAVFAAAAVGGAAASKLVGSKVPSVELHTSFGLPDDSNRINLAERCKGKKVIVLGLPGAFTPT